MTEYNKRSIYNKILKVLSENKNKNDARDMFITAKMANDMTEEKSFFLFPVEQGVEPVNLQSAIQVQLGQGRTGVQSRGRYGSAQAN